MRVLILNPPVINEQFSRDGRCQSEKSSWLDTFPPTTLASVAGCVREKHETILIDCIGSNINEKECTKKINSFKPDFIVSNSATPTIKHDIEFLLSIKNKVKTKVIIYGEHVTNNFKNILDKKIDYVILGEPETPIMNILKGNYKVDGVATKRWTGKLWREPNLDNLPLPAYDLLPKYYYPLTGERWMFVRSGRGCPYNCSYCIVPNISGRKVRYHSVEYMIKQFKWLAENLDIKLWMFWDDISTVDKERIISLCKEIIKNNIHKKAKWFCTTRVDFFDNETAEWMSKAGCKMMSFGFESGNQKILDINNKGITLKQSKNAIKNAKKYKIKIIGHFIVGLPGSTKKRDYDTIKFAIKNKINFAQFYIATPFISSNFYKDAIKNNWLIDKNWEHTEQGNAIVSYPNYSNKEIAKIKRRAYILFYFRPYAFYSLFTSISVKTFFKLIKYFFTFMTWVKK